ncbi:cytochrome p450 [Lichtheimia corymbifera JMRC:FSU:9682]|uniref:Cytochrome p450 n=1 Tax=Lichtheimia corymbifera JMRC:FSU:9682 TaxID=1263082 RepID=A0A068S7H7_9FUNG|nr:cytochrome p450 [Lichtheimia corymbifera JMRC:FSU:9682]
MDSLLPTTARASIQKAIDLIQKTSAYPVLHQFYQRSSRNELLVIGGATFLTLYNLISYVNSKRQKLHLPPRVAYGLPLVGHLPYILYDGSRFLDWCVDKYGEVFDLSFPSGVVTVTSGRSAEEALKADSKDLSLEKGVLEDTLFMHYVFDPMTFEVAFNVNPGVAKDVVAASMMPTYTAGILRGLDRAIEERLGGKDRVVIDKPSQFLQRFVGYMSVPTLLGDELETNREVIQSFAEFTGDVTNNVAVFLTVPNFLHRFILPYLQRVHHHRQVMRDHVMPVVRARRQKMREAEARGEPHNLPKNFLQGLTEYKKPDGSQYEDDEVARTVLMIAFAAVHTTSMNLSFCLHWLMARPDLKAALEKEIQQVIGDGPITDEGLKQMTFLDQFVRESLRQSVDKLANSKKVLPEQGYTFQNGYQVPQYRVVQSMNRQLNLGLNVNREDIKDMDPNASGTKSSTTPSRDFVTFGLGRHLCPGRFFAVHEIKLSLITLLRKYEINTLSGKPPKPVQYLMGYVAVNSEEPIVFTKKNHH